MGTVTRNGLTVWIPYHVIIETLMFFLQLFKTCSLEELGGQYIFFSVVIQYHLNCGCYIYFYYYFSRNKKSQANLYLYELLCFYFNKAKSFHVLATYTLQFSSVLYLGNIERYFFDKFSQFHEFYELLIELITS